MTSADVIREAAKLARAGQRDEALTLLRDLLQREHDHVMALCWLAGLTPDVHEGIALLERASALDPENAFAKRGLATLRAKLPADATPSTSPTTSAHTTVSTASPASAEPLAKGTEAAPPLAPQPLAALALVELAVPPPTPKPVAAPPERKSLAPVDAPSAPAPLARLRVVEGSPYLREQEERRGRRKAQLYWACIGLLAACTVIGLAPAVLLLFLRVARLPAMWPYGAIIIMLAVNTLLLPIVARLRTERDNYRAGRLGEEKLSDALQAALDSQWTLFRNVLLDDNAGDIDAVLTGPQGIYALEVKAYSGYVRNRGDAWERRRAGAWRPLPWNPTRQANRNAARLGKYLHVHDTDVWVEPRVVWAGKRRLLMTQTAVPLWFPDNGPAMARDALGGKAIAAERLRRVNDILENLCLQASGSR